MGLALFDFDQTITRFDTLIFFAALLQPEGRRSSRMPSLILLLAALKVRLVSETKAKRLYAHWFLRGRTRDEIEAVGRSFSTQFSQHFYDDTILRILKSHVEASDQVFVVTSNFECLLHPLTGPLKLDGVIGTRVELTETCCTGLLVGLPCTGAEKVQRAISAIGSERMREASAYGDSSGDYPLLRYVRSGYLVRRPRQFKATKARCVRNYWRMATRKPPIWSQSRAIEKTLVKRFGI